MGELRANLLGNKGKTQSKLRETKDKQMGQFMVKKGLTKFNLG